MPKVSVIIPAYNMARYTVEAIKSVLNQTFKDYEIVVVDDGSTDNTKELLQPYIESHQITYIYKENGGACSARNVGIRVSRGEYIAFLDCDDLWLPKKLEISIDLLDSHPEIGFVYSRAIIIDKKGDNLWFSKERCYSGENALEKLIFRNFIRSSSPVVRKECFKKVGLFDETIFHPADRDMWLRISEYFPIKYINIPLIKYRVGEWSYFERNIELAKAESLKVLEKTFERHKFPKRVKGRAIAYIYLNSSLAYSRKLELQKAKKEILTALRIYPFCVKSYIILFLLYLVGRYMPFIYRWKRAVFRR